MAGRTISLLSRRELWAAAATDTGRQRDHNEDAFLCSPESGLFAVIDGVGGELAGETSSRTAAEILQRRLTTRDARPVEQQLRDAIAVANNRIYEMAHSDAQLQGMACVLTAAVIEDQRLLVGHVGDTRLYRLGGGRIEKLTRDHSPVGVMEERSEIPELEAMQHPRRNEIFRDVGSSWHRADDDEFVDLVEARFARDQAILLCSDGLTDQVTAREIREVVEDHAGRPQEAVDELVRRANAAGGRDNVTVVLIEAEDFAPASGSAKSRPQESRPQESRSPARSATAAASRQRSGKPAARARRPAGRTEATDHPASRGDIASFAEDDAQRRRAALTRQTGSARAHSGRRWPRMTIAALLVLALAAVVAVALVPPQRWPSRLPDLPDNLSGWRYLHRSVLRVGPEGDFDFTSISKALGAARRGQQVLVEPGSYSEPLELKDGVALVSRVPRAAVLRLQSAGTADEAVGVLATGVRGATIDGFRILAAPGAGTTVGLRLVDSEVVIENVEIQGATGAGIEIRGSDRSTLSHNHLHDNPGTAIRVLGTAAPQLLDNLFQRNGGASADPALEIGAGSAPLVVGNRFFDNGFDILAAEAESLEELRLQNHFGGNASESVRSATSEDSASRDSASGESP